MARINPLFAALTGALSMVVAGCGTGGGLLPHVAPATHGTSGIVQAPGVHGILTAVSCPSSSACAAVGDYYQPAPRYALTERWNGTRWSIVAGPPLSAHTSADLTGISCTSASDCTAVGNSTRVTRQPTTLPPPVHALIEHWNGSAWSIVKTPNPAVPSSQLAGVACGRAWGCQAVGQTGNAMGLHVSTLAERWTGSRWVIVPSPSPEGATYSALSSISCPGRSDCVAVGEYFPGGRRQSSNHPLIERWNGSSWALMPSPQPPGSIASYLSAVSCPAASDCVAVGTARYPHRPGDSYGGDREHTLIERWNGSAWAIVKSPNPPGPPADRLTGVACGSASDCVAVGGGGRLTLPGNADGARTLVERWNGSTWAIEGSPSPSVNAGLSQVACPSPSDCTAVGGFGNLDKPATPHTLIEHWNGSAWSLISPAPRPPSRSIASARVPACTISQLTITLTRTGGAVTGEVGGYLRFANHGPACQLTGWPTVLAITAKGKTMPVARALHGTMLGAWQRPRRLPILQLKPGASAYAVLAAADQPVGNANRCLDVRFLHVTPPASAGHVTLSARLYDRVYLPACATAGESTGIEVSAVVPLDDLAH